MNCNYLNPDVLKISVKEQVLSNFRIWFTYTTFTHANNQSDVRIGKFAIFERVLKSLHSAISVF